MVELSQIVFLLIYLFVHFSLSAHHLRVTGLCPYQEKKKNILNHRHLDNILMLKQALKRTRTSLQKETFYVFREMLNRL